MVDEDHHVGGVQRAAAVGVPRQGGGGVGDDLGYPLAQGVVDVGGRGGAVVDDRQQAVVGAVGVGPLPLGGNVAVGVESDGGGALAYQAVAAGGIVVGGGGTVVEPAQAVGIAVVAKGLAAECPVRRDEAIQGVIAIGVVGGGAQVHKPENVSVPELLKCVSSNWVARMGFFLLLISSINTRSKNTMCVHPILFMPKSLFLIAFLWG